MNASPSQRSGRSSRPVWLGEDRRRWDHVRIHIDLICDPRFDAFDVAVYAGLVVHAEVGTGAARPSQETLAGYVGCSVRRVRDALVNLRQAGWVEWSTEAGKASTYRLLPPPTPAGGAGVPRQVVPTTPAGGAGDPGRKRPGTPAGGADELEKDEQELQNGAGGRPSGPPSPGGRDAPAEVDAWSFDRDLIGKARGVLRGER